MKNFIELNMKNSHSSLNIVDSELKTFKLDDPVKIIAVKKCSICGMPESITKLYDGICGDCAKHYSFDNY